MPTATDTGGVNTFGQPISQAGGSIVPTANSALIATSGASRNATSTNVSKLQSATTSLIPGQTDAQRKATIDATGQQPAPQGTTINIGGSGSTAPSGGLTSDQMNAAGVKDSTGWTYDAGTKLYTPPAGTSTSGATATGGNDSLVAGIKDPNIAASFKSSLDGLDQGITQAQATLTAAQATLANDPAAAAAVAAIQAKYDQQIQLMKEKNRQIAGGYTENAARSGALQYANDMTSSFLNDEQARADGRINDLISQEQNLILKAQIAYKNNDVKALNAAMTAYDKANSDKLNEVNKLLTATSKQVSQAQAQQKIDLATQKQQVATDISKSTNLGTAIAKNIADSGITDAKQIEDYIASVAQEYGITNPDILKSAIDKAQAASDKASLSAENTKSIIAKRNQPKTPAGTKPGVDGGYTYTTADINQYKSFLAEGGKGPDGTKYSKQGPDGYIDPGAYVAALNNWTGNKGTAAGFAAKFPPKKYVNPTSYGLLPDAIRPKAPLSSTTQVPPP